LGGGPWLTARALCRRAGRFSPKPNPGVTKIEIGERTGARQDAHVRRRRRSSTHIVRAAAACRVSSLRVSSLRSAPHVSTCSLRSVSLACASVCAHVISPFHSQFAVPPPLSLSFARSFSPRRLLEITNRPDDVRSESPETPPSTRANSVSDRSKRRHCRPTLSAHRLAAFNFRFLSLICRDWNIEIVERT